MSKKINISNISNKINFIYRDECEKNTAGIIIYHKDGRFFFDAEYKNEMTIEEVESLLLRGAVVDRDGKYYRPSSFNSDRVSFSDAVINPEDIEVDLSGYALKKDIPTKVSELQNDSNFLSSIPSEYVTETDLNNKDFASKSYVDAKVANSGSNSGSNEDVNVNVVEPEVTDMPKVFFYGNALPTTKDDVELEMDYVSNTMNFHSYIKLKCQGSSSMSYVKKNFTINMYNDEDRSNKLKKNFKDWGEQSKFCLKANYVDTTHTRNLTGARIAADMVKSRPNSPFTECLKTIPTHRNGAVDGFPVRVYFNGEFHGIYTWNIPKGGWMFGMDEDNDKHWVLCANVNSDGNAYVINSCQFRQLWTNGNEEDWTQEFGTFSQEVVNSLNRCIEFVMNSTDEEFHNNINQYFDLYSLIDYYCFSYLCCHLDGLAKNMLLATYDGIVWGAMLYDMDSCFGAMWDGKSFVASDYRCPEDYQEQFSRLWSRLEECFSSEIRGRYFELRKDALSLTNIITHAEEIYDIIPDRVFNEEHSKWNPLPSVDSNTMTRFRKYMSDRSKYVDNEISKHEMDIICESIEISDDSISLKLASGDINEDGVNYLNDVIWKQGALMNTNGVEIDPTSSDVYVELNDLPIGIYTFHSDVYTWKKSVVIDEAITYDDKTLKGTCNSGVNDTADITFPITVPNTKTVLTLSPNGDSSHLSEATLYRKNIDASVTSIINHNVSIDDVTSPGWFTSAPDHIAIEITLGSNMKQDEPYLYSLSIGDLYTSYITNANLTNSGSYDGMTLLSNTSSKGISTTWNNDVYVVALIPKSIFGNSIEEFKAYCLNNNISSVVVNKSNNNSNSNSTYMLNANVLPPDTTETIVWSVYPSGIVSINQSGVITTISNGECVVTATCGSCSDTCAVEVRSE